MPAGRSLYSDYDAPTSLVDALRRKLFGDPAYSGDAAPASTPAVPTVPGSHRDLSEQIPDPGVIAQISGNPKTDAQPRFAGHMEGDPSSGNIAQAIIGDTARRLSKIPLGMLDDLDQAVIAGNAVYPGGQATAEPYREGDPDPRQAATDAGIRLGYDVGRVGGARAIPSGIGAVASAATGGASGSRPTGLGMFLGQTAEHANLTALEDAKNLIKQGISPKDVKASTGWEQGPDGHWSFEITDQHARILPHPNPTKLGDVLEHPDLYYQHPDIANLPYQELPSTDRALGGYDPKTKTVMARDLTPYEVTSAGAGDLIKTDPQGLPVDTGTKLSTILHELQHHVQDREEWPRGANLMLAGRATYGNVHNRIQMLEQIEQQQAQNIENMQQKLSTMQYPASQQHMQRVIDKAQNELDATRQQKAAQQDLLHIAPGRPFEAYEAAVGEAQSRNTQLRQHMSERERRGSLASASTDVDPMQQIVYERNPTGTSVLPGARVTEILRQLLEQTRPQGNP